MVSKANTPSQPALSQTNVSIESVPNTSNVKVINLVTPIDKNTVSVDIFGTPVRALIDTGASISCIAQPLLDRLRVYLSLLQKCDTVSVFVAGGENHCSLGSISLPISFGDHVITPDFHLFEKFHQPLILGIDFLQDNSAIIDASSQTLRLKDKSTETVFSVDTNVGISRATTRTIVPAMSISNIQVEVSNLPVGSNVLLEPLHELPKIGLAGAKCVSVIQSGKKSILQVMNPSDKDVVIFNNKPLASASVITNESVFSLESSVTHSVTTPSSDDKSSELSFDLSQSDLSDNQRGILRTFLNQNKNVFANDLSELGHTEVAYHSIDTADASPMRQRFYRQSPEVKAETERQIQEMLDNHIITESYSMWQSPVVMVRKKNGQLRFAVDYRKLNAVTKQFTFPLPRLEDVFESIGEAKAHFFSTLDLASGFWQIPMDPQTAHKTAFVTPTGVYQWRRMPFGLVNAPASFQALMTKVLKDLNWKTCLVYVDDILVFSRSFDSHLQHLQEVFDRLRSANLTLNT